MIRRPTVVALAALACWPATAAAWSTMPCAGTANGRWYYADDAPFPVAFGAAMPPGDWARLEIERALTTWNQVDGAADGMSVHGAPFSLCQSADDAGYGVVAWDDGTCMAAAGNSWGPASTGITIHWGAADCRVQRVAVYLNSTLSWTPEQVYNTALHELGHYQVYRHNWFELSIMGYSAAVRGTDTPMDFLTARDHHFLRTIYPDDGPSAAANLHLHPYLQLDALGRTIVPDSASYDEALAPSCSSDCSALTAGDTITVQVTAGNTGAVDATGPVDLVMTLGDTVIGTWTQDDGLLAHHELSFELTATVPDDLPAGTWPLRLEIDPAGRFGSGAPSGAGRAIDYPDALTVVCPAAGCAEPDPDPEPEPDLGCPGDTCADTAVSSMDTDVADTHVAAPDTHTAPHELDAHDVQTAADSHRAGDDTLTMAPPVDSPSADDGCGCVMLGSTPTPPRGLAWWVATGLTLALLRRREYRRRRRVERRTPSQRRPDDV